MLRLAKIMLIAFLWLTTELKGREDFAIWKATRELDAMGVFTRSCELRVKGYIVEEAGSS